jgi:hypothetical protein
MSLSQITIPAQACGAIIQLLRGVVYNDAHPAQWQALLAHLAAIRDYFSVIQLEVFVDEAEGFGYLRQNEANDEGQSNETLPRLIQRRPLSYPVSLLCVLLRRKLAEQDVAGGETRLVLGREQIVESLRVFLPDSANEAKLIDQVDQHMQKLVDYGFLRRLKGEEQRFEVRRIVKALVDAQWLGEMNEKLEAYRKYGSDSLR